MMDEKTVKPADSVPSIRGFLNLDEAMKSIRSGAQWGVILATLVTAGIGVMEAVNANMDKILTADLPFGLKSILILAVGAVTTYLRSRAVARKLIVQGEEPPLKFVNSLDRPEDDDV